MPEFNGISAHIFNSCEKSEKIRIPINLLKDLREVIEPELRKINPHIKGHVSRIKDRGTNNYRNWAWLYFNTQPKEAYRYSQLAVNISPKRLFVGVDVRTPLEYRTYKKEITNVANTELFENLAKVLSTRELFFTSISDDWEQAPRQHSIEELKGQLLSPNLFWINIPFEKDDPKLASRQIASEIVKIFKDLYNVYAFASGNKPIQQNVSSTHPFVPTVVVDNVDSTIETDQSDEQEIADFLSCLKESSNETTHHLPGKNDQIIMKRKALRYDLEPLKIQFNNEMMTIYSDNGIKDLSQSLKDYAAFAKMLSEIGNLFPLPQGFLKIMYVNPLTDVPDIVRTKTTTQFS